MKRIMKRVTDTHPPLFKKCPEECTVVLVRFDVREEIIYGGRCSHEVYYWAEGLKSDFELEYLIKHIYYRTDIDSMDRVYRVPILISEGGTSLDIGVFSNPFVNIYPKNKAYWFFRRWFYFLIENDNGFYNKALKMEGKILNCPDKYHHTDIIKVWFERGCQRYG